MFTERSLEEAEEQGFKWYYNKLQEVYSMNIDDLLQNVNNFIHKMEENNMPESWQKVFLKLYIAELDFQNIDSISKVC